MYVCPEGVEERRARVSVWLLWGCFYGFGGGFVLVWFGFCCVFFSFFAVQTDYISAKPGVDIHFFSSGGLRLIWTF